MGATKEVEYTLDGKTVKFIIKKINYGEYQKIASSAGNMELIGGQTRGKIDTTKFADEVMKAAVSGPVDFHQLDVGDGIDLQTKVFDFNGMGETKSFPAEQSK